MADFMQEWQYSLRQARRSPGFFLTAVLMLAMGLAATIQIFTLVDVLLLRPLPVKDPENLVQVFEQQPKRPASPFFDYRFYKQLSRDSSTLSEIVGQIDSTRAMEWQGHTERVHEAAVTDDFFATLKVAPQLGRVLRSGDSHVAVLSDLCWARSFGRDSKVVGQIVRLQGHPYEVVGVAAAKFTGTTLDSSPDLWIPYANLLEFSRTPNRTLDEGILEIVARLRPGVTPSRAQEETAAMWNAYIQQDSTQNPENYQGLKRGRLEVRSIAHGSSGLRDQSRTALVLLLAGTGLLLLMVYANVGGLLLARVTARERDTAVRVALGAGRWRILRQWLMESLVLTVCGWCGGLLLAYATMPAMMRLMPPARSSAFDPAEIRTLALQPGVDLRVALFSLGALVVTALLCALAPAARLWNADVSLALKNVIGDGRSRIFQAVLCGVQIALCTVILLSGGLVTRSLSNLRAADTGLDVDHVTVFSIDPHVRGYDSARNWAVQQQLMERARNLPGVASIALASRGLMRGIGLGNAIVFPGQPGEGVINTSVNSVTPGYFETMGIRFLTGRNFTPSDGRGDGQLEPVIVNAAFVRKFLNGRNPVGVKFGSGRQFVKPDYEIIGVVSDSKYRSLREIPPPISYNYAYGPKAYPDTYILHVQSRGDPHAVVEPVRQLVRSIDPELPVYQVATLSEEVDQSLWQERLLVTLTSCFGVFASGLSALGLYGIMAYYVTRRRREIGLCIALGAGGSDVLWLVVRRVVPTLALGILAGTGLFWMASAWVRSLLYGVESHDPITGASTILLLAVIGSCSAAFPVIRAMHVDPVSSLRQD